MFLGGKGAHDLGQIANQRVTLNQQRINVTEGSVSALVEFADAGVLRANCQHQPQQGEQDQPQPPVIEQKLVARMARPSRSVACAKSSFTSAPASRRSRTSDRDAASKDR
jgi:hypothetical protein